MDRCPQKVHNSTLSSTNKKVYRSSAKRKGPSYRDLFQEKVMLVEGIPSSFRRRDIIRNFNKYGPIIEYRLKQHRFVQAGQNILTTTAIIQYARIREDIFNDCPQRLGKYPLKMTIINGKENILDEEGQPQAHLQPSGFKVFIGNLPTNREVKALELVEIFHRFGEIEHCYPVLYQKTLICKGFGFIIFKDGKTAHQVVNQKSNLMLGSTRIFCDFPTGAHTKPFDQEIIENQEGDSIETKFLLKKDDKIEELMSSVESDKQSKPLTSKTNISENIDEDSDSSLESPQEGCRGDKIQNIFKVKVEGSSKQGLSRSISGQKGKRPPRYINFRYGPRIRNILVSELEDPKWDYFQNSVLPKNGKVSVTGRQC